MAVLCRTLAWLGVALHHSLALCIEVPLAHGPNGINGPDVANVAIYLFIFP
jgi:hypothetical protein